MAWVEITAQEAKSHHLFGLKGVLAVLLGLIAFQAVRALNYLSIVTQGTGGAVVTLVALLPLICSIAAFWALASYHRRARWIVTAALLLWTPCSVLAAATLLDSGVAVTMSWDAIFASLIFSVAFVVYLHVSRRVRVTFEHRVRA